jgi:hypothetical protein
MENAKATRHKTVVSIRVRIVDLKESVAILENARGLVRVSLLFLPSMQRARRKT